MAELAHITRRGILKGFAAGSAVAIPTSALAFAEDSSSPLSDEEQLEACIAQLKGILQRMHPRVDEVRQSIYPMGDGYGLLLRGVAPPVWVYDGPGNYQVSARDDVSAGVYYINDRYCEMDRRIYLFGRYIVDGEPATSLAMVIDPCQIVRKLRAA